MPGIVNILMYNVRFATHQNDFRKLSKDFESAKSALPAADAARNALYGERDELQV